MRKQDRFISVIAPLAVAEKQNRARWILPSICIAQGALESGWNTEAKTLFGIKGKGTNLKTVEYINGKYESVTVSFKAFPTIAAAVHGYYELLTTNPRYSGAVNCTDYITAVQKIAAAPYATDPDYANKVISIIRNYNLTRFDTQTIQPDTVQRAETVEKAADNLEEVARKVIRGDYGNGAERKKRLAAAGYNYSDVQKIVNRILKG